MRLEPMAPADWPAVVAIYEEGMATGVGTFETTAPRWEEWDAARLAEREGIWTLQGATIATNAASLALQTACGFRIVGRRERIAKRDGRWHDTVLTERRSAIIGLD